MITFFQLLFAILASSAWANMDTTTAIDVLQNIYTRCADSDSVFPCIKPKVIDYFTKAVKEENLSITKDMSIIRSGNVPESNFNNHYDMLETSEKKIVRSFMLDKLNSYLRTHYLEMKLPETILKSDIVPRSLINNVPSSITVPLFDSSNGSGRGFIKKVLIPFLLGLKFKATALVPLALSLIALKTWKALTLGLLSLVLSGAMMIFKLTKPKVAYEIVHYGHSPLEQSAHWETTAQHGPYRAYRK